MQQGLIDGGAIQTQIITMASENKILINDAEFKDFIVAVKTGNIKKVDSLADPVTSFLLGGLFRALTAISAELPFFKLF